MVSSRRDAALKGWDTRRLNLSGCGHPWRLQTLERTGYIYVLTNLVSGKQYTGQALDAEARWAGHISAALEKNSQYPIHRAICKYGVKKFSAEVVHTCSESLLDIQEEHFIRQLKTHVSQGGYNQTWGGDGVRGLRFSEKSKAKLSASLKKYFTEHPEAKITISKRNSERVQSVEERRKRAEIMRGKKLGPSSAGSLAALRRWRRPEYRAKNLAGQRRAAQDPEIHRIRSEACKRRYADPEQRRKSSELSRAFWARPGFREMMSRKMSVIMKRVGQTPAYREQMRWNRTPKAEKEAYGKRLFRLQNQ